jgi:hypothetical protein
MKPSRIALLACIALSATAALWSGSDASAQPKGQTKPAPKPAPKPPARKDAGAEATPVHAAPASSDAGGAPVVEKTLDGGAKVFRFGEMEIEGRLRSPQLVYFLRRVRAEFAAGDLGHRSFMLELSQTRQTENF